MFCLKNHDHASIPVKVSKTTDQPLPFHCKDCEQVSGSDHNGDSWADMFLWRAILEGRSRCEQCFPK